ncbi:MAG: ABC transporter permease subunit [Pseudolabrys sp.]
MSVATDSRPLAAGQQPAAIAVAKANPWSEQPALFRYGFLVILLIVWEIVGPFINPIFFTYPSKIAVAFYDLTLSGELPYYLGQSLEVMVYGLSAALVVGIPLGIAMARFRRLDWALDLPINALYATPLVAVVPLLVLWFGIYLKAKIIVVFLFAVFPVLINTYQGVRECDKNMLEVGALVPLRRMADVAGRAVPFRGALHHRRHPPRHRPRADRHDHRRVLHHDLRPRLHDHALRQRVRDGQGVRAGDRADGARCVADLVIEMGRPPRRAVERRQPVDAVSPGPARLRVSPESRCNFAVWFWIPGPDLRPVPE